MKKYKNYYDSKVLLCNKLVASKRKKIKEKDIRTAALELCIPYSIASRAWQNFVENSGIIDKRKKSNINFSPKERIPVKNKPYTKSREVSKEEAAKILLEFMTPGTSTTELSNKYKVSIRQIYDWIHEIQVSGKLYNTRILNPEEYSKPELLTVIAYKKNPKSKSKRVLSLSDLKKMNYERVADILYQYLISAMNNGEK